MKDFPALPLGGNPILRSMKIDFGRFNNPDSLNLDELRIISAIFAASRFYGIDEADIIAPTRKATVVRARHVAMVAVHAVYPEVHLTDIGAAFGARTHCSVIHAIESVTALTDTEPDFAAEVEVIVRAVRNAKYGL